MKREYVKPVMESEMFVANEYVAACMTFTCYNCKDTIIVAKNPVENSFYFGYHPGYGHYRYYYSSVMNGESNPCTGGEPVIGTGYSDLKEWDSISGDWIPTSDAKVYESPHQYRSPSTEEAYNAS